MNGKAKIEVLDAVGNTSSTQEISNLVTPALTDYLDDCVNWYKADKGYHSGTLNTALTSTFFKGTDQLFNKDTFGLVLYDAALNTDGIAGYTTNKEPFAYAGSTITQTADHGTLISTEDIYNTEETTIIGVRLCWEFTTTTAVGTIASACLVPRELCDNNPSRVLNSYSSDNINIGNPGYDLNATYEPVSYIGYASSSYTQTGRRALTIMDDGTIVKQIDGAHKKFKTHNYLGATSAEYRTLSEVVASITGFSDLFKVIDAADENCFLCFGTAPSGNRAFVSMNKDTLTNTVTEVSCVNASTIYDWGLCGDKLILLTYSGDYTSNNTYPILYVVNMTENTYTTMNIAQPGAKASYIICWNRQLLTYRTVDGDFACDFAFPHWYNRSSYVCVNFGELYAADDGTISFTTYPYNSSGSDPSSLQMIPNMNFGLRTTCFVCSAGQTYGSNTDYFGLGFARRTLFTICNLDTPIEKTSEQIVRVTYDLTWGE